MGRATLLSLILASCGCASVAIAPIDRDNSGTQPLAVAPQPSASEPPEPVHPLAAESIIARGTSPDGDLDLDLTSPPFRSNTGIGELPTCSLNPVLNYLGGDNSSRCRDDAYQSMTMLGLNSAIHILRGMAGSMPRGDYQYHFHRSADFLDDMLQPDDDSTRAKQVKPPCIFTLGCNW